MSNSNKIYFVTIATHSERYFPVLKESAENNGIDLKVLGWGKEYTGHYMKDDLMIDYLENEFDENEDPIIVFVDGFDSVFLAGPEEFKIKFLNFEKRLNDFETGTPSILISRDFDPCWFKSPFVSYCYWRVFHRCDGIYINAGMFAGRRKPLLEFLKRASAYRNSLVNSNQIIWSLAYLDHKRNREDSERLFAIDSLADMMLNYCHINTRSQLGIELVDVDKKNQSNCSMSSKRLKLSDSGVKPCVISGPGCSDMDDIINKLGYTNFEPKSIEGKVKFGIKKVPYYVKAFYPEILAVSVGLICVGGMFYRFYK